MITAIFVIIMMATLAALIQNITGKTIKATTQQYQKEQASLLARSYSELAILYITGYDRNNTNLVPANRNCLNHIQAHFGKIDNGYDIEIEIKYIGKASELFFCDASRKTLLNPSTNFGNTLSILLDVYVHYKSFDDPSNKIRTLHRRTLQKI